MVHIAWLTGTEQLNRTLAEMLGRNHAGQQIVTVSEFPMPGARWIPYHPKRTFEENRTAIQAALQAEQVTGASMILVPRTPFGSLRRIAMITHGTRLAVYDKTLCIRPWPAQLLRFAGSWAEWHVRPTSFLGRWMGRVARPAEAAVPVLAQMAYRTARLRRQGGTQRPLASQQLREGVTAIIPSRNGRALLQDCLLLLVPQGLAQIVVVDNGSDDDTATWLQREYPAVAVIRHATPLSFADAIHAGLVTAKHKHILLLNNDMRVEPGFVAALQDAFQQLPELFCATAQILFPPGVRREETGKAVLRAPEAPTDFPVRCDLPLPGEDGTWVLYGSGGCSLFDTKKLLALGGLNRIFKPAYVEDLDLGYRAWQQGWPTVFCAEARVEHRHRSTTARYFTQAELDDMVQVNYLRFLSSAVCDRKLFLSLWDQAIRRLHLAGARRVLQAALRVPLQFAAPIQSKRNEAETLALTNGDVAVFPGSASRDSGKPRILIATPYLPYPLSHGGAVRIFNLMRETRTEFDLILLSFVEQWEPPPQDLLALVRTVVLVRRYGSHYRVSTARPDTVEEFASETFRAALRQCITQWQPHVVQLEWTQMAQYAPDCAPAKTILVEHDITFDLYEQIVARHPEDRDAGIQMERWRTFENAAWRDVTRVVTMSDKDRLACSGAPAVTIPNGVDIERFQPSDDLPEPHSVLFIGSFAHQPNRSGLEWFLRCVWPLLDLANPQLCIIAGKDYERWPVIGMDHARVTVKGFTADVRPDYRRAAVVVAPLLASAGTNIKVLEAMAMGKQIVSTTAGVNGLTVEGVTIADTASAFATAILRLFETRHTTNYQARACVERDYSWHRIAKLQAALYRGMQGETVTV